MPAYNVVSFANLNSSTSLSLHRLDSFTSFTNHKTNLKQFVDYIQKLHKICQISPAHTTKYLIIGDFHNKLISSTHPPRPSTTRTNSTT